MSDEAVALSKLNDCDLRDEIEKMKHFVICPNTMSVRKIQVDVLCDNENTGAATGGQTGRGDPWH